MKLHIVVLTLYVALSATGTDVKNVQTNQASCECKMWPGSICASHFHVGSWYGLFPNARSLDLTASISEFFHFLRLLRLDNYCSHALYNLLCFHYFPKCSADRPQLAATPCRETCTEAVSACLDHARAIRNDPNFVFPGHLNCTNFESGSISCDGEGASGEDDCSSKCTACPNATIHVEFATEPGKTTFEGSESEGFAEVCLRLANVGSYDPDATLTEDVTVNLCPTSDEAEAGCDFIERNVTVVFPVGSAKGKTKCVNIEIINDGLKEGQETFVESATIVSPNTAIFGGAIQSSSGNIKVNITDNDCPEIPQPNSICKSSVCAWRTKISRRTLKRNPYSYVTHVRVIGCGDSLLDVEIVECFDIVCGVCPPNRMKYSIPYCSNCMDSILSSGQCPIGAEYVIAGNSDDNGILYIGNYRKGGLCAQYDPSDTRWKGWVPQCRSS